MMPSHVKRLVIVMAALLVCGLFAKSYFTPESFGDYGYYRGASVAENAALEPRHQARDACQMCHWERFGEVQAGTHAPVNCQVCHGPAGDHPASGKLPIPTDTRALCTLCHEAMPARPKAQPQVVSEEHAGTMPCIACHNPHSPRIQAPAQAAAEENQR